MTDTPTSPFTPFQPAPMTPPPPAEKPMRQKRKKVAAVEPEPVAAPPRQRRKKTDAKPALKFDLQTILSAAAMLNDDDQPLFEKLVGILQDAGKPGRERLLAAIGKIFA